MGTSQTSSSHTDEEYIDMEVSSCSSFVCYSINSPPQSREFEFQMCPISHDKESTTCPADELFYKGKLLPLHLPPRLQMVQKLLHIPNPTNFESKTERVIPSIHTKNGTESCNISASESCRVSSELNPDDYFFEWSTELRGLIGDQSKRSWTRKLKQSSLGQKLKASRAYLRSLFSKNICSNESCAKAGCNVVTENVLKEKNGLSFYLKVAKKKPFGEMDGERYKISGSAVMKRIDREMIEENGNIHRRSFSGAIQRHCATNKCFLSSSTSSSGSSSSSSSFSFSSNGFYDLQLLKRSSSANSEVESSIDGAIAHCKQSQQNFGSRKQVHEVGVCAISTSRIGVCGDQESQQLCSICVRERERGD